VRFVGALHMPVDAWQVPAFWHWFVAGGQVTGFDCTQMFAPEQLMAPVHRSDGWVQPPPMQQAWPMPPQAQVCVPESQ
jgi:hypothetical protein